MSKNILITGAGGTLGCMLLNALPKEYRIKALSSQKENLARQFENAKNISFYRLEDFYGDEIDFGDVDIVLHLAFARTQSGDDLIQSIDFSKKIFQRAEEAKVKHILHISSQSLYGNMREKPSKESDLVSPFDMYGMAKYACEVLGSEICAHSKILHIRLASLLSPFLPERIVNKMISSALLNNEITVMGGKQIFSYLDTRDAIEALLCLLTSNLNRLESLYNIGSNTFYSIHEIAQAIQKIIKKRCGKNIQINFIEKDIQTQIKLDSSKFNKALNWQAKYSLEDSIEWIGSERAFLKKT